MSLGFLTESALLPSKAKKITGVDTKSILDLKAIIYEKEQELEQAQGSNNLKLRKKIFRSKAISIENKKNKGIEKRRKRDEEVDELEFDDADEEKKKRKSLEILKRKAIIYDQMAQQQITDKDSLVNFEAKPYHRDHAYQDKGSIASSGKSKKEDQLVEIMDELGRTRTVKMGSTEYLAYISWQNNENAEEDLETNTSSHVVSQWEKTLKANEKTFLAQVAQETKQARNAMMNHKQMKRQRLKKLRERSKNNYIQNQDIEEKGPMSDQVDDFLESLKPLRASGSQIESNSNIK